MVGSPEMIHSVKKEIYLKRRESSPNQMHQYMQKRESVKTHGGFSHSFMQYLLSPIYILGTVPNPKS